MLSDYSPIDKEDLLTAEDVVLLKAKYKKERYGLLVSGVVIFGFVALLDFPLNVYHWILAFMAWFGIGLAQFFRHRSSIERGKKRIIRGTIAQRYKSESDEQLDFVMFINGIRLEVPTKIYKQYYTGDFVEFHFFGKVLLQHKLLKRGTKEYA